MRVNDQRAKGIKRVVDPLGGDAGRLRRPRRDLGGVGVIELRVDHLLHGRGDRVTVHQEIAPGERHAGFVHGIIVRAELIVGQEARRQRRDNRFDGRHGEGGLLRAAYGQAGQEVDERTEAALDEAGIGFPGYHYARGALRY